MAPTSSRIETTTDEAAMRRGTAATRCAALDMTRGVVVLAMLFVNDIGSANGTPAWLKHARTRDTMTVVDVVFPAFLFIVGLSLPYALGTNQRALRHTAYDLIRRTVSLLALGVMMVNAHDYDESRGFCTLAQWELLVYTGAGCIWLVGQRLDRWLHPRWRKTIGVVLWLSAIALFRSQEGPYGGIEIGVHWWGILGLIGWAYFGASLLYLLLGKQSLRLNLAAILCCALFVAAFGNSRDPVLWAGIDVGRWLIHLVPIALVLSGAALSEFLAHVSTPLARLKRGILAGFLLLASGVLAHDPTILSLHYSKWLGTPPWAALSAGITAFIFAALTWTSSRWSRPRSHGTLVTIGQAALLAFLLEPSCIALFELLGAYNFHHWLGAQTWPIGALRAFLFTCLVVGIMKFIRSRGLRFHL